MLKVRTNYNTKGNLLEAIHSISTAHQRFNFKENDDVFDKVLDQVKVRNNDDILNLAISLRNALE